jgi:transcriptional regulator with XRE-family HTH domain
MNYLLEKKPRELTSTSAGGSVIGSRSQLTIPRNFLERNNTTALYTTVAWDWLLASEVTTSGFILTEISSSTQEVTQKVHNETRSAINELRKLSGLTWEQLAKLFNVSRRTLHFWASGKPINSPNEEKLNRLLGILRYIDRGSASLNRNLLLMPGSDGTLPFDLLVADEYEKVKNILKSGNTPQRPKLNPLSEDALKSRKPLSPENLIDALQEPIHREVGRSRPAKSVRSRKK